MSDESTRFDHGPIQVYEVVWESGHVERIEAHQVSYSSRVAMLFGQNPPPREVIEFHGEIGGHWRLQLRAPAADILIIRNVTTTEAELS